MIKELKIPFAFFVMIYEFFDMIRSIDPHFLLPEQLLVISSITFLSPMARGAISAAICVLAFIYLDRCLPDLNDREM